MIRETLIDKALNRLIQHFGSLVVVRPPASARELSDLEQLGGALPRDLSIFLSTCNGFRIGLVVPLGPCRVCGVHEIMSYLQPTRSPGAPPGLVPVRDDDSSDVLVLQPGALHGVMLRWQSPSDSPAVMASSLGAYLDALTRYWVEHFDTRGRPNMPIIHDFDDSYIALNDSGRTALQASEKVRNALRDFELLTSGGCDLD